MPELSQTRERLERRTDQSRVRVRRSRGARGRRRRHRGVARDPRRTDRASRIVDERPTRARPRRRSSPGPPEYRAGHRVLVVVRFADAVICVIDRDDEIAPEIDEPLWRLADDLGTDYRFDELRRWAGRATTTWYSTAVPDGRAVAGAEPGRRRLKRRSGWRYEPPRGVGTPDARARRPDARRSRRSRRSTRPASSTATNRSSTAALERQNDAAERRGRAERVLAASRRGAPRRARR